jgi:hypothetical protein
MKVTVAEIAFTEEKTSKAGKQYTLTTFKDETGKLYKDVYGKLNQGDVVEGEWKKDTYGNDKFEINRPAGGFGGGRAADPATRASIERQSALKAAVEAVHNYTTVYGLEEKLTLNAYANRIVNLTRVFAEASAGATPAPVPTTEKTEAKPEAPQDRPQTDEINLDDIPF